VASTRDIDVCMGGTCLRNDIVQRFSAFRNISQLATLKPSSVDRNVARSGVHYVPKSI